MTIAQPLYLQAKGYPARLDRQFIRDVFQEGVHSIFDFGTGASTGSRSLNVGPGTAYIPGTQSANQGTYRLFNDATINLPIAAAGTFPRIDQIIARVYDSSESGVLDIGAIEVLKGVEASGADLNNRLGAVAVLPANSIRLIDVLAPVGSGLITWLRDRRKILGSVVGGAFPIGGQLPFAGINLPTIGGYWAWADGGLIDKVTFADFFANVGHFYNGGVDPGSSLVRKPDKRGRVSVGADSFGATGAAGRLPNSLRGFGQASGAERHNHTTPDHLHGVGSLYTGPHVHSGSTGGSNAGDTSINTGGGSLVVARGGAAHYHDFNTDTIGNVGVGGATGAADRSLATDLQSSMQPYEVDHWIVRIA